MVNPISYQPQQAFSGGADFSALANLGEVYKKAQNERRLSDLGQQLASGSTDYRSAAGQLAAMGDPASMLKFLTLAEQQRKEQLGLEASKNFGGGLLTPLLGGGAKPSATETVAAPPTNTITPSTPSTPGAADTTVDDPSAPIRTNPDGTIAGNITSPTQPAAPVAARPVKVAGNEPDFLSAVPGAIAALRNPYLPEADKEIAKDIIKRGWDSAKPTEKIQTLNAMRDDPKLFEMEKELRRQTKTDVNILPGEKAQDVEMGKTLGELHASYVKDALKVPANKANLDAAERAMATPGFVSGAGEPAVLAARRAAVALGLADEKTASAASSNELFAKLQNKAIMDAGGSSSGLGPQISNNDAKIIRDSTFNSSNTIEGNRKIIGFQRLLEDRKVEYAREINRYARAHGNRIDIDVTDHMAKWSENNPLDFSKVPGLEKGATAPRQMTQEEFNAAPSGTVFVDPNGVERRKP